MNILQSIRKDNLSFRKSKSTIKANLTTTLIGEITTRLKDNVLVDFSEEDITLAVLRKMHKSISSFPSNTQEEELNLVNNPSGSLRDFFQSKQLNSYLPKMMTLESIQEFIESNYDLSKFPNKIALTGKVMKSLNGKANGKDVSTVLKSL